MTDLLPGLTTVRSSARGRLERLRLNAVPIVQTALAAAAAWLIAREVVGHTQPAFAPIGAVISLGVARGQSVRRAVELVVGVAVGIGVADLLVALIGRSALSIALIVGLSMAAALLLGAGTILVSQAAVSAIFVVALQPPSDGFTPDRFYDALIGGAVALAVAQLLLPRDPLRLVADATRPLLDQMARTLDHVADALERGDPAAAADALVEARAIDHALSGFYDALEVARESAALSPPARRKRGHLRLYTNAARQVDYAVRNTRVLARAAMNGLRKGRPLRPLAAPVQTLADAVRALVDALAEGAGDGQETRRLAIAAARQATEQLDRAPALEGPMLIGQVRATAVDLLRGAGLSYEEAMAAIDSAAPIGP